MILRALPIKETTNERRPRTLGWGAIHSKTLKIVPFNNNLYGLSIAKMPQGDAEN